MALGHDTPRHQRPTNLKKFLFGCPYYPEHWTDADRKDDPARMAAAGVNVVRMAEFAWDLMEPTPGKLDFSFFDEHIARLGEVGISTILCTPTATPPRWMTDGHPELFRVDEAGKRMDHGSRQHVCTNNEDFRAQSRRITEAMGKHFAGNANVIGWQTDNELYCGMSTCYCQSCTEGFQQWLKARYGTIDKLNTAWGNAFWALTFNSFEQVPLSYSQGRPANPNPTHELDHFRYLSDSVTEFQRQQVELLRKANGEWFVTHNGMFSHIDYWKFTEDLDFLGIDIYPAFCKNYPDDALGQATISERARASSGGFIVPEIQSGYGGQKTFMSLTPRPGQMRLWAYQAVAHGSDGMLHFRWRTCRYGAEEYWGGILDHDNVPRRRYQEFSREGNELKKVGHKILNTVLDVKAAVLIETDQDDSHGTYHQHLPTPSSQAHEAYGQMWRKHLPCGSVQVADSFDGLKLLVLPSMLMMDAMLADKLKAFVENGGVLVVTARSSTKDRNNHVISQTPPGLIAQLCGVTVEEFGLLEPGAFKIDLGGPNSTTCGQAYEVLALRGAQSLGRWSPPADFGPSAAAGEVAISINRVGSGAAIYVGTYLTAQNAQAIMNIAISQAKIEALAQGPEYVEIMRRKDANRSLIFVLNHYPSQQSVRTSAGMNLLTDSLCEGEVELEPFGVAIIEENEL